MFAHWCVRLTIYKFIRMGSSILRYVLIPVYMFKAKEAETK